MLILELTNVWVGEYTKKQMEERIIEKDRNNTQQIILSLLEGLVIDCVGVEILMCEILLVGPNLRKIKGLHWLIAETLKIYLLEVWVPHSQQCILLDLLIKCFSLYIVNTDAKEISFTINRQERCRNLVLFC